MSAVNAELGYPGTQKISLGSFTGNFVVHRTVSDTSDIPVYAGTYPVYHPFLNTYGVWTNPDFVTPSDGSPQAVNYSTYLQYGGTFTLTASADNSMEVYIGGNRVIAQTGFSTTSSVPVTLPSGFVNIQVIGRNYDAGSPGLFAAAIINSSGNVVWSTRSPLNPAPISINEEVTGTGWVSYLAQGVPTPSIGNNNMDRLRDKTNLQMPTTTIGSFSDLGGYNHGHTQTPNFALTSFAARPQLILGTLNVQSGGNNYVTYRAYNTSSASPISSISYAPPTGQIGVQNHSSTFTDVIQPYATNYYYCDSYTNFDPDYNYMRGPDAFLNFQFVFLNWVGN
jgi:hypothetical protein